MKHSYAISGLAAVCLLRGAFAAKDWTQKFFCFNAQAQEFVPRSDHITQVKEMSPVSMDEELEFSQGHHCESSRMESAVETIDDVCVSQGAHSQVDPRHATGQQVRP